MKTKLFFAFSVILATSCRHTNVTSEETKVPDFSEGTTIAQEQDWPNPWIARVLQPRTQAFRAFLDPQPWEVTKIVVEDDRESVTYRILIMEKNEGRSLWSIICDYDRLRAIGPCAIPDAEFDDIGRIFLPNGQEWCQESVDWSSCVMPLRGLRNLLDTCPDEPSLDPGEQKLPPPVGADPRFD